ncbi:type VI secretion system baseplate subunit TssE [Burkholderia cepacia]|uniref:type VI secretion system baseplate subunit TssE n=1 Tax=Burkholderia cepacia TaxID=292 RepID=UPI003527EA26
MNAPQPRHRTTYMPSLIDRLIDDAPQRQREHRHHAPDSEGMHRLIRRDLSLLLNTTNLDDELDAPRHTAALDSVVNYGIPPLSGSYLANRDWNVVEKMIRAAIVRFEPRLLPDSLRIHPIHHENPIRYNRLIFEISGLMHWSPIPVEFRIRSMLDMEIDRVTLDTHSLQDH